MSLKETDQYKVKCPSLVNKNSPQKPLEKCVHKAHYKNLNPTHSQCTFCGSESVGCIYLYTKKPQINSQKSGKFIINTV